MTNFQDDTGNFGPTKTDNFDVSQWASITIKADGNIIFSPSKEGFIKLGGDDADKAILCTDNLLYPPSTEGGQVTYSPGIITSGADVVGTGEALKGTFASKVLVK